MTTTVTIVRARGKGGSVRQPSELSKPYSSWGGHHKREEVQRGPRTGRNERANLEESSMLYSKTGGD